MLNEQNTQLLESKWAAVLDHKDLSAIKDPYRRAVTAVLLENQETDLRSKGLLSFSDTQDRGLLEAAPANAAGSAGGAYPSGDNLKGYVPVLISLIRRSMPNLIAFDIVGVQPMAAPVGLVFAMKARYDSQAGDEALFNEADTTHSGKGTQTGTAPLPQADANAYTTGIGLTTLEGEKLGAVTVTTPGASAVFHAEAAWNEMAFSIDSISVTARTRALKAEYTTELSQDLKAIQGLDAETELANILSAEILSEINREIIRTIYAVAVPGASVGTTDAGIFDLDTDANGRWSVEKYKGLFFQLEKEANAIAKATRRGRGNFILTSSDVASALAMAGLLDTAPALQNSLNVDDTGDTFAGVLNGRYRVYIDPYIPVSATNYFVVGYKGQSPWDAGLFYCPYVPLQMVRNISDGGFQPRIGFKTRYGLVANPFAVASGNGTGALTWNTNIYYRKVQVAGV